MHSGQKSRNFDRFRNFNKLFLSSLLQQTWETSTAGEANTLRRCRTTSSTWLWLRACRTWREKERFATTSATLTTAWDSTETLSGQRLNLTLLSNRHKLTKTVLVYSAVSHSPGQSFCKSPLYFIRSLHTDLRHSQKLRSVPVY